MLFWNIWYVLFVSCMLFVLDVKYLELWMEMNLGVLLYFMNWKGWYIRIVYSCNVV